MRIAIAVAVPRTLDQSYHKDSMHLNLAGQARMGSLFLEHQVQKIVHNSDHIEMVLDMTVEGQKNNSLGQSNL